MLFSKWDKYQVIQEAAWAKDKTTYRIAQPSEKARETKFAGESSLYLGKSYPLVAPW